SNAIKYSDPKKADRFVEIGARVNDASEDGVDPELNVEVRDNGIGIPSEARDKVCDRFFRALDGNAPLEVEGTGLGLSIVRETVEMLGGRAWAETSPIGGSVFAFSLPCRRRTDGFSTAEDTAMKIDSSTGKQETV